MVKKELLLVHQEMVEQVLTELTLRGERTAAKLRDNINSSSPEAKGVWEQFMEQFEALTAVSVVDGTAVIPLRGMVTPDDPFAVFYGETNLAMFNKNVDAAVANPKVKAIALNIYSPGGYVYGVEAAANRVFEARKAKPVVAYTDSLAASAAYWIASAASKIILGSETAQVGSIGVYLAHFDYSEMLAKQGIKVTEVTAGEFKGIGSPYAALSAEERKKLEQDVHYVYTRFVNTVARNRGMSVADVLKSANGLTFYGSEAIAAGLADSINTFQEVIAMTTPAGNPAPNAGTPPTPENTATSPSAAELAAIARAEKAEADAKALRDKAQADELARAADECKAAVKATFGREATAEEITFYQKMDEGGRKVYKANLAESSANRDKIIQRAGLTKEQVEAGSDVEASLDNNLVYQAMVSLGYASKPQ